MTIHLSPELEESLQGLADEDSTTTEALAQQAISEFVDFKRILNESVRQGRADVDSGRVVSSDEVFARMQGRFATR